MDPMTTTVAQRQAAEAAKQDRADIRMELSVLWFGLGCAVGVLFTLAFMDRL